MKRIFYIIATAVLLASSAHAADLYQPDVVQAPPPEVQVVSTNGWYLRGDAGLAMNYMHGGQYWRTVGYGSSAYTGTFDTESLSKNLTIGGGVGYQFNSYLRGDVTMDYGFTSTFHGTCCAGATTDISHMTNLSLLANAYVDMGTYAGITPYVGAGLGTTYVSWDGDYSTETATGITRRYEGRNSWRFTWALMAGASVDLTCNLKADVGYRYRHINGGSMFGPLATGAGTDPVVTLGPGDDHGFSIHEVRAGLRYTFGDGGCGQVAYVPPAPMPVYK